VANDVRKDAVKLSDQERGRFLEAFIRLKHKPASIAGGSASVYDQFVALHQAIMAVTVAGMTGTINMGHWNIGFCPWHREYLRRFELALQQEVPGVTIPYWDWIDMEAANVRLFSNSFLGRLPGSSSPQPITAGVLAYNGPNPRPAWWPNNAAGWRIHPALQERGIVPSTAAAEVRATLHRAGDPQETWPPAQDGIRNLIDVRNINSPVHDFWYFWRELEAGRSTHNTGHRFIGGHMAGALSPNDPIFWLHHANVDRIWASWQDKRGGNRRNGYPPSGSVSPFDGDPAPTGHNVEDIMWPWVGNTQGYGTMVPPAIQSLLIDYAGEPARRVKDVLDPGDLGALGGYSYA